MKKIYLDKTKDNGCISIFLRETQIIPAGTTISSMIVKHKNEEYRRFEVQYDIHFIFEDNIPKIDFYAVPQVDIFAVDSKGGFIGAVGQEIDLESDAPICYIDEKKKCYLLAISGSDFLEKASDWRNHLQPYQGVKIYDSKSAAEIELEFYEWENLK